MDIQTKTKLNMLNELRRLFEKYGMSIEFHQDFIFINTPIDDKDTEFNLDINSIEFVGENELDAKLIKKKMKEIENKVEKGVESLIIKGIKTMENPRSHRIPEHKHSNGIDEPSKKPLALVEAELNKIKEGDIVYYLDVSPKWDEILIKKAKFEGFLNDGKTFLLSNGDIVKEVFKTEEELIRSLRDYE